MLRLFSWLGRRLAFIALASLGAAIGLLIYSSIGQAGLVDGDNMGGYTYTGEDCDEGGRSDPINIVFYQGATSPDIDYYLSHEGGWGNHGGETQYFKTYGNCYEMDGMKASGRIQTNRYHGRYHRGLDGDGNIDIETPWLDYSIANAHYEIYVFGDGCGVLGNHVVPQDGFNEGRENVVWDWTEEGEPDHFFAGYGDWGNIEPIRQCNGDDAWSNGQVAIIRTATGDVEGMSLSPDSSNLWVCYNSTSHECNPWYGEGLRFVIEGLENQSGIGLGGYHFDAYYNQSLLSVDSYNGSFLGSTGRNVSCSGIPWSGYYHQECQSDGDERGPAGDGDIAALLVSPKSSTFYVGNPAHRPARDNGIALPLDNVACRAKGTDGAPLPGSDGDYTPECDDGSVTVRILEGDLNLDCRVDVADDQAACFRYGCVAGLPCYNPWYDVEPTAADGDIDIQDLQFVFGRNWSTCQAPIPDDQGTPLGGAMAGEGATAQAASAAEPQLGLLEGGTNVLIDPPSQTIPRSGQSLVVYARVSDVTNPGGLGGYQFTLQFDPNILTYLGISPGGFLGSTGADVECQAPVVGVGTVSLVCNTTGFESQRPSGSGELAHVFFRSAGSGVSPLNLTEAILVDPPGEYIATGVANGSVTVNGPSGTIAVGGTAEYPELEPETAAATTASSAPLSTALVGAAAGGAVLLLVAGGLYLRFAGGRRRSGGR